MFTCCRSCRRRPVTSRPSNCIVSRRPIRARAGRRVKPGLFGRMVLRFKQALAEGEATTTPGRRVPDEAPKDFGGRVGRFVKRKLAAAVAEQRVLWHLRNVTAARLHHR